MRLHTSLTYAEVVEALSQVKREGNVAGDVQFTETVKPDAQTFRVIQEYGSQTHARAFEIQLGVPKSWPYQKLPENYVNQFGKRQKTRRTSNGDAQTWAATWHEWGWFIAEIFRRDNGARWGQRPKNDGKDGRRWGYFNPDDFHAKTKGQFLPPKAERGQLPSAKSAHLCGDNCDPGNERETHVYVNVSHP